MNDHSSNSHCCIGGHLLRTETTTDIALLSQFRGPVCSKVSRQEDTVTNIDTDTLDIGLTARGIITCSQP